MDEATTTAVSVRDVSRTRNLVVSALLAALLAASAWIAIPTGAVPVTLQVFIVLLCGLLLPLSWAAVPVVVYVVLGAVGVPVFSGAVGGPGVLLGPTGGYIFGFVLAAPMVAAVRTGMRGHTADVFADGVGVFFGLVFIYALGWLQLTVVMGLSPMEGLLAGVVPFVALDVLKGVGAVLVAQALRRAGF
jgi:biotin transport system substrate-specific component